MGKSLQDRITELKERKPACTCFESAIHHPLKIVEYWFKYLSIDGFPVVVKPYLKEADLKVLNDALLAFDPSCDPEIQIKSQLQFMKKITKFMNSPEQLIMP